MQGRSVVEDFLYSYPVQSEHLQVVAIGKAAESMLQGSWETCGNSIERGILITKHQHLSRPPLFDDRIQCLEAAHPFADQTSLDAGQALLAFLEQLPPGASVLFLISGGASSLVEVLATGFSATDLNRLNSWLLAQGWPIDVMNRIRKSVSCIKGGRLCHYLNNHPVRQLLISDVPGDDPSVIGSGLLVADSGKGYLPELPSWVRVMQQDVPPAPVPTDACFRDIETVIIADNARARTVAAHAAVALGYPVQCNEVVEGDVLELSDMICQRLLKGEKGIYIWGGEATITLPVNPGQGGRCQALALSVAKKIQGHNDIVLLAAGTDGTDGPGDVAGALIDGQTIARGEIAGLDVKTCLRNADSGRFLEASGDLLDTGPTGTNVMDLIVALKY